MHSALMRFLLIKLHMIFMNQLHGYSIICLLTKLMIIAIQTHIVIILQHKIHGENEVFSFIFNYLKIEKVVRCVKFQFFE